MKVSKFIIVSILFFIFLFNYGCKKHDVEGSMKPKTSETGYYFMFKKDGVLIKYDHTAGGIYEPYLNNQGMLYLSGRDDATRPNNRFTITLVTNTSTIPVGVYETGSQKVNFLGINYELGVNSNQVDAYGSIDAPGMGPSHYSIQITSITDSVITGTFNGNYLRNLCAQISYVSEGVFRVKREH
jgi:hypothetical protein